MDSWNVHSHKSCLEVFNKMKTLREIISEFSKLVLDKFEEVQSIKIIIKDKMKKKIAFKKFREERK